MIGSVTSSDPQAYVMVVTPSYHEIKLVERDRKRVIKGKPGFTIIAAAATLERLLRHEERGQPPRDVPRGCVTTVQINTRSRNRNKLNYTLLRQVVV